MHWFHSEWSGQVYIMAGGEVQCLGLAMIGYMRLLERFGEGADELARARE